MTLIEREAGLQGKLLRPLSAKLLAETEIEQRSWVERELLLDIQGRSRRRQIDLAEALGVIDYPCPAGGCLLTDPIFCTRLKDLITHEESLDLKSISLLKVGRQFRYGPNKIIVGRNQEENRRLMELKSPEDLYLEVPEYGSPITLLLGPENEEAIRVAASITARYSDAPQKKIEVKYGRKNLDISIIVSPSQDRDMAKMRVE
jgi:hypothetical protein